MAIGQPVPPGGPRGYQRSRRRRRGPQNPATIRIPNYVNDYYDQLVENDPLYKQQIADLEAMGVSDAARRQAGIRKALIEFGFIPQNMLDPYSDIDETTRALAERSTESGMSQSAMLERQRQARLNDLASRGLLDSSERGFQEQEAQNETARAQQELLEYLRGLSEAFGMSEAGRARDRSGVAEEALARQMALNPDRPNPNARLIGGTAWYRKEGKLYNRKGQMIDIATKHAEIRDAIRKMREKGIKETKIRNSLAFRRLRVLQRYL